MREVQDLCRSHEKLWRRRDHRVLRVNRQRNWGKNPRWLPAEEVYKKLYGTEQKSWSGKNVIYICRILDGEYPPVAESKHFFELMYCQIYRYGSSATHRTMQGLSRHLTSVSATHKYGGVKVSFRGKEQALVFNCLHSLIAFLCSMRVVGRTFNIPSVEDYFQQKVGSLIALSLGMEYLLLNSRT